MILLRPWCWLFGHDKRLMSWGLAHDAPSALCARCRKVW